MVGVRGDLAAAAPVGLAAGFSVVFPVGLPVGLPVGFPVSLPVGLLVGFPVVLLGRLAALLPAEASRNKGLSLRVGVDGGFWSGIDRFSGADGFPDTGLVFGCCKGHIPKYGKTQEKHARNRNRNR